MRKLGELEPGPLARLLAAGALLLGARSQVRLFLLVMATGVLLLTSWRLQGADGRAGEQASLRNCSTPATSIFYLERT
jgi:hypothetical protein